MECGAEDIRFDLTSESSPCAGLFVAYYLRLLCDSSRHTPDYISIMKAMAVSHKGN